MIEFVQGELVDKGVNSVVILVGGIGYRLNVSALTLSALPSLKKEVTLFAHLHLREDEISLYGFISAEEKELFQTLLSVSGIGPKLALAILSKQKTADLKRAVVLGDTALLVSIPGVGKKTAERIILELKDKIAKQGIEDKGTPIQGNEAADVRGQAVTALLALGYSLAEAQRAVPVNIESYTSVEELIRTAFKNLTRL